MQNRKRIIRSSISVILILTIILSSLSGISVKADSNINSKVFVGNGFNVTFTINSQWAGAFNGDILITNTGNKVIKDWSIMFYLENRVTNIWNASIKSYENSIYCIQNATWNQNIPVGGSVSFGFSAESNETVKIPISYYIPIANEQIINASEYKVDFAIDSDWGIGFSGRISITNLAGEEIKDWVLQFDFEKNIESIWNGNIESHISNHYVIHNNTYNQNINPGATVSFGFNGASGNVINLPQNYILSHLVTDSNCNDVDTDNDGISNGLELHFGTNVYLNDSDGDTLTDYDEVYIHHLDPLLQDTDADGVLDAEEITVDDDPNKDTDKDGIIDKDEINIYYSNPFISDTDSDGLLDGDEIILGLNPISADTDNNGIIDSEEKIAQTLTVPLNDIEKPEITEVSVSMKGTGNIKKNTTIQSVYHIDPLSSQVAGLIGVPVDITSSSDFDEATITFKYNVNLLGNTKEEDLAVLWYDLANNQFIILKNVSVIDTNNHTISYTTTHFSTYMIVDSKIWSDTQYVDNEAPAAPTNITLTGITDTTADICWSAATDNSGVTQYLIYSDTVLVGTVNETIFNLSDLKPETIYHITVYAKDSAGNLSDPSTQFEFKTTSLLTDNDPPSAPSDLVIKSVTGSAITIMWNAALDNVGINYYKVYCNNNAVGTTYDTSYTYSGMNGEVAYSFYIIAFDIAGNESVHSNIVTAGYLLDTQIPSKPENLVISSVSGSALQLTWSASEDNVGIEKYVIYCNDIAIGSTSDTNFVFSDYIKNNTYNFFIISFDAAGNKSNKSNVVTVSLQSLDLQAPTAPANLTIESVTGSAIILNWEPSTDNIGVEGYEVFCNGYSKGTTTNTSYTYTDIIEGITYSFFITSFDAAGNKSNQSNDVSVNVIDTQAPSTPKNFTILKEENMYNLHWDASADDFGVDRYEIFCNEKSIGITNDTSYVLSDLATGYSYDFYVLAYDKRGNASIKSDLVSIMIDGQAPSMPTNPTIIAVTGSAISLEWNDSTDNVGVFEYEVYCNGILLGKTKEANFTNINLSANMTYSFKINAIDEGGNISESCIYTVATVSGTISRNTKWNNNVTYIIVGNLVVNNGITLEVKLGTIVKFYGSYLAVNGNLLAQGTIDNPIIFTSLYDPDLINSGVIKPDTYRDIIINESGRFEAKYLNISYLDTISNSGQLNINYSKVYKLDIIITSNYDDVIIENNYLEGSILIREGNGLVRIENNYLKNGNIRIGDTSLDGLSVKNNIIDKNAGDEILIKADGIASSTALDGIKDNFNEENKKINTITLFGILHTDITLPKYIYTGDLEIANGVTLTVQPGTTFLFQEYQNIEVKGRLIAEGTIDNPIIFTSKFDPEFGGSGVLDYVSNTWGGININSTGEFIGNFIEIKYIGHDWVSNSSIEAVAAIRVMGRLNLTNSKLIGGISDGIRINTSEEVNINSTLITCFEYGINIINSKGVFNLSNNEISNNSKYPIYINGTLINAYEGFADNNIFNGNRLADAVYLSGYIGNITLPGYNYILDNGLEILGGKTVILAQDLKFFISSKNSKFWVSGKLMVQGTSENPVIFTSLNDPDYGGNGTPEEWNRVYVSFTGNIDGNYLIIKQAIGTAIEVEGGSLHLNHSQILAQNGTAILVRGYYEIVVQNSLIDCYSHCNGICITYNYLYLSGYSLTIINNIISNASYGLSIEWVAAKFKCSINNNTFINNIHNAIAITLNNIKSSAIFSGLGEDNKIIGTTPIGYYLTGNMYSDIDLSKNTYVFDSITIPSGKTLTLQPGTILLGSSSSSYIDTLGKLKILGNKEYPVVMTSIHDKKYGGDGAQSTWKGVKIQNTGGVEAYYLDISSVFNSSYSFEVFGSLVLKYSKLKSIYFESSILPTISYNSFNSKVSEGIWNNNPKITIDASNNYWNSINGPYITLDVYDPANNAWKKVGYNTDGAGVFGNIIYQPYLGSEFSMRLHFGQDKKIISETINKETTYAPTGNFSYQTNDLEIGNLLFTRSYNSQDISDSVFGKGWSFNFESYIYLSEDFGNILLVKLPDSSLDSYMINNDGAFISNFSRNNLIKMSDGGYLLTTKDQIKYRYNSAGKLTCIEDNKNNKLTVRLNSDGKPESITDYVGREYTLTYQGGLLDTITGPAGHIVKYYYNNDKLVKVVDPEGIVTNYVYDANGYLSRITDGEGNLKEGVSYKNSNGIIKVDTVTDAYGNVKTYSYDELKGKTIITDSNGRTTTQWYDTTYNITNTTDVEGKITSAVYYMDGGANKYGEVSSSADRYRNITTYIRDDRGNYTKVTNPDNSCRLYTYDTRNNLTSECDEAGKYTYYIYDSTGTYLIKMIQPLNGTDAYTETSDPSRFAITSYTFYQKGEDGCTVNGLIKSITNPEGNTVTYTYDSYGNIKTSKDSKSNTTTYTYDETGLLLSTLSPKGELTNYTYDNDGNLTTKVLDGGETTVIVYDGLGREVQEITPSIYQMTPSGDVGNRYTHYGSGKLQTVTDPEGNITTYTYDLYGNLQSETNPNGCIYWYEYDALNRMTATYVQETSASQKVLLKTCAYAVLTDKKTQKTETVYINATETAVTVYVYDYAGRLVKQANPDGGIINTVYNANGTVYSQSDAKGKLTYSRYDGLNRLTDQWVPFGDSKYTYKAVTYDRNGNTTSEKTGIEAVALWAIPATILTTAYEYNEINQLITVTDPEDGKKEYAYDADGNVIKETGYLDSEKTKVTEYVYNYLGKPESMTVHVEAGDIYGNTFGDTDDILLVTTYTYDADGNIRTMVTPDGVTTTYTYDFMDRQLSQTMERQDEYGQPAQLTTSCTYDFAGNVLTATDANRNTIVNTYTQRGLIDKTTDTKGGITAFYYDNAGRLTAKVLPRNYYENVLLSEMNRIAFTYDKMNRIILEQDIYYDEKALTFRTVNSKANQYDYNGNVVKTLDALGYNSGTGTTISGKINTGYGTTYTYNDANLLLTTLSPVSKDRSLTFDTKYTYDAAGRKITKTNANKTVTKYYYDNNGKLKKTSIIDTTEKVLQLTTYDKMGNILTQTDGNGNVTRCTYNRLGLLKTKTTAGDTTIDSNTFIYQYDDMGRVVYQKDSMGKVITYTYNHSGQLLGQTEKKEDGSQSITKSQAYDKNGNQRFSTDANGVTTEYVYDELNRVTQTKITVNGIEQISSSTYDKNGNLLTTTDWLGNTYSNEYDALNRIVKKTDPYGKTIEQLEYNDNNAQTKSYDALGNMTVFAYDKNERLTSTTDPAGHVTSQTYDNVGNIASKKDGKNNTTAYAYDVLNRLIRVTNAASEITGYTYDLNGNMLTQTDGKVNTITYTYNASNLPSSKAYPADSSGVITSEHYTYYPDGRLKEKTDRNGNLTEYTYDIHGNLLSMEASSNTISYTYDPAGNMLTMTDPTGLTSRTYDELGRVLTKTVPDIGTITYEYDIISGVDTGYQKEKSTDPKGNVTEKVYDKAGRLTRVIVGDETTVYTYYDNGNTESVTYSNGSREEYTYYADNRIKTLVNKKADTSVMDSYTYTYDNAGNQLTKYEIINNTAKGTTTYTYDALNRLQRVTEPNGKVTTYTYDKAGNRLTETVVYQGTTTLNTYAYDSRNRLTSISIKVNNVLKEVTGYAYDGNGNLLKTTVDSYTNGVVTSSTVTATFTYDLFNQLTTTATEDGTVVNNAYNAEGYRTVKEVNGVMTYYLYEADKVILEVDEEGNQTGRNVYGINLLMRSTGGETYCYMYNGHADVTALITSDGTAAAAYYYDAFGNILESSGDVNNSILYSGYQYDKETGLYYLNARMYDPKIARFLQEDTYTGDRNDPLSLNLYTYCSNNPIKYDDPSGHAPTTVHERDTNTIVYAIFCNKIEEESKEIIFYKKGKKGKNVVDTGKTEYEREKWIDKQEKKAKNLAEKLVAGDKYVDQQELISNTDDTNKKDYDFKTFHAFNLQNNLTRCIDVLLLRNFSYHAVDYYMSGSKGISPKLSLYLGHATYDFTVSTISMSEPKTNKDNEPLIDQNGNIIEVTSYVILPLDGYSNTERAMFMSGMGLHTLQDSRFHIVEKHKSSPYVDVITYDYDSKKDEWTDINSGDFTIDGVGEDVNGEYKAITFTGGNRYKDTLQVTARWAKSLVANYGDQMFGYK